MDTQQPQLIVLGQNPFHQQQVREPQLRVPPRVCVAMEFLNRLTAKTAIVPLPNYMGDGKLDYTPIDGQRLSDEEANAQATACNLLSRYFAGDLPDSPWDKPDAK